MKNIPNWMTLLAIAAVFSCDACADDNDDKRKELQRLPYYLNESAVKIVGTVTTKTDIADNKKVTQATSTVTLVSAADNSKILYFRLGKGTASNVKVEISFRSDGTLASVNSETVGQLGSIIKNIFRGVTTILSVTGGALPFGTQTDKAEKIDLAYKNDHPKRAEIREKLKDTDLALRNAIADQQAKLAGITNNDNLETTLKGLTLYQQGLGQLRQEAEISDAHFSAWRTAKEGQETENHEFVQLISELPDDTILLALLAKTPNPSKSALQGVIDSDHWRVVESLNIIVTRQAPNVRGPALPIDSVLTDSETEGFFYRAPYTSKLCLYKLGNKQQTEFTPTLQKCQLEQVITAQSPHVFLPLKPARFGKAALKAEFSEAGAITTFKSDKESALADASGTFADLPDEVLSGIKKANEILDADRTLQLQELTLAVEETKKEKELLELQIAHGQVVDLQSTKEQIAALEQDLKLLETQGKFAAAQRTTTTADATSDLNLQKTILELQNAIEKLEIDRVKMLLELKETN